MTRRSVLPGASLLLGLMAVLVAMPAAVAQVPAAHEPVDSSPPRGELWPLQPLSDDSFAVSTRALALRRDVRMYQWRAETGVDGSVRWSREWADALLETPAALKDDEHVNPGVMPFRGATWRASAVELDGHPVEPALYSHFEDWTPLAVAADTLPPNLAASFREVDGCLYSGEDASVPAIGDLRICWETLPAGPIEGAIRLDGGRWVAGVEPVGRGSQGEDFAFEELGRGYWLLAGLLLGVLLMYFMFRGRGRS
ncbi:MAG: hypothetical protein H7A20_03690 [Rhodanobacteraceae bacterium]|nr:hypothetical protein [Xanthomonadales bacterium]MCP5477884.1 hypothetical protein [Rhodanobacteraceae bacterium]HPF73721.1 TMEM43 family protein [Xanthomonadaceae bacterium]